MAIGVNFKQLQSRVCVPNSAAIQTSSLMIITIDYLRVNSANVMYTTIKMPSNNLHLPHFFDLRDAVLYFSLQTPQAHCMP